MREECVLRHNRFCLDFLFHIVHGDTPRQGFCRSFRWNSCKNPQTSMCQSRSHSITLRRENVVKRRWEIEIPRMMVDYLGFDVWRFERRYKTRYVSGDRALDRASGTWGKREKVDIFRLYSQRRLVCADRTTRYLERGATKGIWLPEFMPGGCVTC